MITRRTLTKIAGATPWLVATAAAGASGAARAEVLDVDTRSLDALHRAALSEGGRLVVYGGGDIANGAAGIEAAFTKRFPGMTIRILVDRSKYQGFRIDNQLSLGSLQCDVAHILAWHFYDRWKTQGELLAYRPAGWDAVFPDFKDPDGMITAVAIYAFSTLINTSMLTEAEAPRDSIDFLDPKYRGKIALTYPHDDDSILYQFERIVAKHGWGYIDRLMKQDILWNRGSGVTRKRIENGEAAVSFTTSGPVVPNAKSPTAFLLPKEDTFLSWAHPGAIFAKARHPEAAKLYMSWLLSAENQGLKRTWSVRADMPPPDGRKRLSDYNTSPVSFRTFLRDRADAERFRDQLEQVIGPMQGANPTGVEGIFPEGRRA